MIGDDRRGEEKESLEVVVGGESRRVLAAVTEEGDEVRERRAAIVYE